MIRTISLNIIRFAFLILVQALIVNRLNLWEGLILPQVYIFFLLMIPISTPRLVTLIIGFITGLTMDIFTSTPGLHAAACLTLAYVHPFVLRILSPREGYEPSHRPTVQSLGFSWYISYAAILTFIHHFILFFLEVFRLSDLHITFSKIVLSGIATVILLVIGQYLIFTQKSKEV